MTLWSTLSQVLADMKALCYSNVPDYLTPVSSGGIDTMGTIEERRITHCCQKLK